MSTLTRRHFVRSASILAAAPLFLRAEKASEAAPAAGVRRVFGGKDLRWLGDIRPRINPGTTWGRAWPQGACPANSSFSLQAGGAAVPVQSWPTAYWPDGSVKWSAHAIGADAPLIDSYTLSVGTGASPAKPIRAQKSADGIVVANDHLELRCAKGQIEVKRGNVTHTVHLLGRIDRVSGETGKGVDLLSAVNAITLEQDGPIRGVVKVEGALKADGKEILPFIVRFYVYAASPCIRIVHTVLHNADPEQERISAIGLRCSVPLDGELHDRHVRFTGLERGVFGEAVRGLTGLRRDPGKEVREAQFAGLATGSPDSWNKQVSTRLQYIPAFGDWTLFQGTSDGFELRKRTKPTCGWVSASRGPRAGGLAYVGTPKGGVALGLRNFWQSYPAQIDIRNATEGTAELTAWMWAPEAQPMDLRPYHDGMGQDTYAEQYNGGLEITYEDYEPGFNSPEGVARTSELNLWILPATPSREAFADMQEALEEPPLLVSSPEYLHACGVFGRLWSPAKQDEVDAKFEKRLASTFDFYLQQREERRWYGFWDFGDVMHSYDFDRHEWKYDVGGFAWDNSELSTDIWLWLYYLRTGRADVFRFAEAMTRHTGEVDVHHIGRFAPLGSRHNVQHWGCSAKQLRISTALNRRYYYYLTADERVGDLMREQVDAGWSLLRIPPGRKLGVAAEKGDLARGEAKDQKSVGLSVGTDWGTLAGAWLTEWERTQDPKMKERLVAGMRTLGAQPLGFFSTGLVMNLESGAFEKVNHRDFGVSHLNAVFGLVEVCAELIQLLDVPEFKEAWLNYCRYYNATPEEQAAYLGGPLRGTNLRQGHSRLTAYAAAELHDAKLAERAWKELTDENPRFPRATEPTLISRSQVMRPVHELAGVSTNDSAQWGLAAIQCIALLGKQDGAR